MLLTKRGTTVSHSEAKKMKKDVKSGKRPFTPSASFYL